MAQIKIKVDDAREARVNAALLIRGQTIEQALEPYLQDIERSIGHDPSDSQSDQDLALLKAQRKGAKAQADRAALAASIEASKIQPKEGA